MTLGRRQIALILIALYVGAVWVRLDSLGAHEYPYFDGESGTNYRYARTIAAEGSLPATDTSALRPDGFSPAGARPNGVEYLTGFAFRLVHPFSDVAEKQFAGIFTILVSSLVVFTFFALARSLWGCAAAGIFAAFLAAFFAPLAGATDGREYLHAPYAFLLVSAHLALFARYVSRPSVARAAAAALAVIALFGVWNAAGFYTAIFVVGVLLFPPLARGDRKRVVIAHFAAAVVAVIAFPYLRGGGGGLTTPVTYWFYRLRFLAGKPDDPSSLPEVVRLLWNNGRAVPGPYMILSFFLPLVWLVLPAFGALRERRKETNAPIAFLAIAVAIAAGLFLIDRSAVYAAALAGFVFVAGTFRGFSLRWPSRIGPVILAVALVATASPLFSPAADLTRLAGTRLGVYPPPSDGFTWASVGNADRELVRYIVTRTSTRSDVILALSDVSSVIAAFAGRSTVVAPGVFTPRMAARTAETTAAFYTDEKKLAETCGAAGATYVLYSIDVLLDASPYSPRYLAGFNGKVTETLAYKMHFSPEKLRSFQLVYENDSYRLFRLTARSEPVFLSDHPPVYQETILRSLGNDLGAFYGRIVDILATYQTAVAAQARGDENAAILRFRYCLEQAPYFTRAWLGVGDSLLRMRKPDDAFAAYSRVLSYAPDDTHALYYGALSLAYTGRRDDALRLIGLLLSATGAVDIRKEALELEGALKSGQRIELPPRGGAGPRS
jgi:hypothetical protein